MVLLLNECFVFGKLRSHLGGEFGDLVKQVHADREIRAKHHRAVAFTDKPLDLTTLCIPSGRPLDDRNTRHETGLDIPSYGHRCCEIYGDIAAAKFRSKRVRSQTSIRIINDT